MRRGRYRDRCQADVLIGQSFFGQVSPARMKGCWRRIVRSPRRQGLAGQRNSQGEYLGVHQFMTKSSLVLNLQTRFI
jgi:hypothetical protein